MKKILISGCCGFIGSHLTDFYLNKKFKVIGIDNLITGCLKNIEHLKANKQLKFINHDVCKPINLKEKLDFILHFASPASPVDYLKYPIETLRIGSIGTENILKLGVEKNAVVLLASTSEVYGDPLEHPQKESYFGNVNPIGPRGVYDEAKRYLEAITMAYYNFKKVDTRIVRIFNTYGPRMRKNDGRAIPTFINQALSNKDFTIFGDGTQTRSFTYIDDTVNGIDLILNSDYHLPINIGNPIETNILELTQLIKKLTGSKSNVIFNDLPENDPKTRKPNIDLAKNQLNWSPKVNLIDGLTKTINFYEQLD